MNESTLKDKILSFSLFLFHYSLKKIDKTAYCKHQCKLPAPKVAGVCCQGW